MKDAESSPDTGDPRVERCSLDQAFSQVGAGAAVRVVSSVVLAGSLLATTAVLVRMLDPSSYGVLAFGLPPWACLGVHQPGTRTSSDEDRGGARCHRDRAASASVARGVEAWVVAGGLIGALAIVVLVGNAKQLPPDERLIIGAGLGMLLLGRNAAAAAAAFALGSGRLVLMDIPTLFANILQLVSAVDLAGSRCAKRRSRFRRLRGGWVAHSLVVSVDDPSGLSATPRRATRLHRLGRAPGPHRRTLRSGRGHDQDVVAQFDVFVLGLTYPSSVVGAYEPVVLGVARMTAFVPVLLMVSYLPAATSLFAGGYRQAYVELYVVVAKVRYVISWPLIVVAGNDARHGIPVRLRQRILGVANHRSHPRRRVHC